MQLQSLIPQRKNTHIQFRAKTARRHFKHHKLCNSPARRRKVPFLSKMNRWSSWKAHLERLFWSPQFDSKSPLITSTIPIQTNQLHSISRRVWCILSQQIVSQLFILLLGFVWICFTPKSAEVRKGLYFAQTTSKPPTYWQNLNSVNGKEASHRCHEHLGLATWSSDVARERQWRWDFRR